MVLGMELFVINKISRSSSKRGIHRQIRTWVTRSLCALSIRPVDIAFDTELHVLLKAAVCACCTATRVAGTIGATAPRVGFAKASFTNPYSSNQFDTRERLQEHWLTKNEGIRID